MHNIMPQAKTDGLKPQSKKIQRNVNVLMQQLATGLPVMRVHMYHILADNWVGMWPVEVLNNWS
jgi:mRNA-degrading endonuclease YafQ of YafQ-DinJ toxin-antitoxin module